jgi:hypothetical protein
MAHRVERRAVRGRGHAAGRRALALPLAALVLSGVVARCEALGAGAAPPAGTWFADLPEWSRQAGQVGNWPVSGPGDGYPLALGGLALGAWGMLEPLTGPDLFAYPGITVAREPLAWFDSLDVRAGEGAAWDGFGASLATASFGPARPRPQRTRAVFHFHDGDFGLDENGLVVERGDSLRFIRAGSFAATRGPRGPLGLAGRHLWGATAHVTFGAHTLDAGYVQRGAASNLQSGEDQSLSGESGHFSWRYRRGGLRAGVIAARGRDGSESFLPDRDTERSHRDAERNTVALEAGSTRGSRDLGVRLEWSDAKVRRTFGPEFSREAHALWGAVRLTQPAGDGALDLALGAGHHDVFGGWDLAPSAAYRFGVAPFHGRVVIERLLDPVWTDLRPGVAPFLQRTWVAGWEIEAQSEGGATGDLGVLLGSSRDRAIVERLPLEEQWLRQGLRPDPERYDFGLFTAGGAWRLGPAIANARGFGLARDQSSIQPAVDPPYGGRAGLGLGLGLFQKELNLVLRAEVEGVGPRESEAAPPRRLDAYATYTLAATFTLGDAELTFRALNLEDHVRPQTWIDPATGREALGVGREFRIGFVWKIYN